MMMNWEWKQTRDQTWEELNRTVNVTTCPERWKANDSYSNYFKGFSFDSSNWYSLACLSKCCTCHWPTGSRGRWPPSRPSRNIPGRNRAWPGRHYRNGWCLQRKHTQNETPRSQISGVTEALYTAFCHVSAQRSRITTVTTTLTIEPGHSDDFQQHHSDDCGARGILLEQLHYECASLRHDTHAHISQKGFPWNDSCNLKEQRKPTASETTAVWLSRNPRRSLSYFNEGWR